jgi:hypothetical protein
VRRLDSMSREETDEIISRITDTTLHLVNTNLGLIQRIARPHEREPGAETSAGPAQEIWMTCTESAGDLVQISYLTAQLVDSLWRSRRSPSSPA